MSQIDAVTVRHHTSRAGDPHRHLHLQINAWVLAEDTWRQRASQAESTAWHGLREAELLYSLAPAALRHSWERRRPRRMPGDGRAQIGRVRAGPPFVRNPRTSSNLPAPSGPPSATNAPPGARSHAIQAAASGHTMIVEGATCQKFQWTTAGMASIADEPCRRCHTNTVNADQRSPHQPTAG